MRMRGQGEPWKAGVRDCMSSCKGTNGLLFKTSSCVRTVLNSSYVNFILATTCILVLLSVASHSLPKWGEHSFPFDFSTGRDLENYLNHLIPPKKSRLTPPSSFSDHSKPDNNKGLGSTSFTIYRCMCTWLGVHSIFHEHTEPGVMCSETAPVWRTYHKVHSKSSVG